MEVRPRHVRHREYERLRHSTRFVAWLNDQAVRLGITQDQVFELLKQFSFERFGDFDAAPVIDVAGSIAGNPKVGETLTYTPIVYEETPDQVVIQWIIDGDVVEEDEVTLALIEDYESLTGFVRELAIIGPITITFDTDPFGPITGE